MLAKLAESGPHTIKFNGNLVLRERKRKCLDFEATTLIDDISRLRHDSMRNIDGLSTSQTRWPRHRDSWLAIGISLCTRLLGRICFVDASGNCNSLLHF